MRFLAPFLFIGCGQPVAPDSVRPVEDPSSPSSVASSTQLEQSFVTPPNAHDVLLVVDGSDRAPIDAFATNSAVLFDTLDAELVDWRIGVVSSNHAKREIAPYDVVVGDEEHQGVRPTDAYPVARLTQHLEPPYPGATYAYGLATAYGSAQLLVDTANADFFRDQAGLHLVVLGTRNDSSYQLNPEVISKTDFIDWLDSEALERPSVSFHSVVCLQSSDASCIASDVGTIYMDVTRSIGGATLDVTQLGEDAMAQLADELVAHMAPAGFLLDTPPPDATGMEVSRGEAVLAPTAWTYDPDEGRVTLERPAEVGVVVTVRYPTP